MGIFMERGVKWKTEGGSFHVNMSSTTGELIYWAGQTPLELQLAKQYGPYLFCADTTHYAPKFMLKTRPPIVVCCFGHTAPVGMMQIPEEESTVAGVCLSLLSLDVADAVGGTNSGSAWAKPIEKNRQIHVQDTFHDDQNCTKVAGYTPGPPQFKECVKR